MSDTETIDDTMAADWAAIQDKYALDEPVETEAPAGETQAVEAATDEPQPETIEARTETGTPPRDESGKFVRQPKAKVGATAKVVGTPEAAVHQPEAAQEQLSPDAATQGQPRDLTRPPSSWKPQARAQWDKISPELRAEIHRREGDFQAGQAQLIPDATFGKNVKGIVEPYRMLIESAGGTPERVIGDMLKQAAVLRTGTPQQKYSTIASIAQFYGIDLRAFAPRAPGEQQGQPQPQPSPQDLRDPRVDSLLAELQTFKQTREQNDTQSREQTVNQWMNAVDDKGQPLRPYVGDVIQEMAALVPELQRTNPSMTHAQALDAAYERATWANPDVRSLLQQQQQTMTEDQRRTENQQRVRDARRGSSVNVARRPSRPSAGAPETMDETIANTARTLGLIAS